MTVTAHRVKIMGVLNCTPDSFSDGGLHRSVDDAVEHGLRMIAEGADILDVGGESSRPGSGYVDERTELGRVIPVVEGLRRVAGDAVPISVDTRKSAVARAALDAGADVINDISALRDDPALGPLVAERGATVVLMHMRGTPRDMQKNTVYADLFGEIDAFFEDAVSRAELAGIDRSRIVLDPGIGFGKMVEHNLALVNGLGCFARFGLPILIGASRKRFIGEVLGGLPEGDRLEGTLAVTALAVARGAGIIRVHDVKENVRVARMAEALIGVG